MTELEPINDDVDLPMQHAAPSKGSFAQLIVWIIALILVLVAIMNAFMGQLWACLIAIGIGIVWLLGWAVYAGLGAYLNSVK